MPALTIDQIFEAAIRIHLREDRAVTLIFTHDSIGVKFPTTRRLADFLKVPHYYVLPYFAMMEQENLVTRAERVGIITTQAGSGKYFSVLAANFSSEAREVLGGAILKGILERIGSSANEVV